MRFGVPIVTTPFGVQGMTQLEAKLPVHSEPAPFADAVFILLTDDAAWLTHAFRGNMSAGTFVSGRCAIFCWPIWEVRGVRLIGRRRSAREGIL